jgi:excisionase family DNA binding protein
MDIWEKDVLTTGEVAEICNVASRTVSKWFDQGTLQGYRIPGSRDRRIPVANLIRFMKEHNIPMDGVPSGNTRLLVVDGDTDVRENLKQIISEQTPFTVAAADSAFSAGVECERFRPHVMLLDLHLDATDGHAICRFLRQDDHLQITKVIATSSKITDGQIAALRQQGFESVLRKPFTVRQVIEAVESAHAVVY